MQVPKGWRFFDAGPFTFYAPSDVADVPLNGKPFDSNVREFQGDAVILMSDYGAYSNSLDDTGEASFHSHDESIGGKAAKLVTYTATPQGELRYPNFVGVYFARTNQPNGRLAMLASCDGSASCHVAEGIFRTIRFR